jgi:hypothetical protein
MTTNPRLAHLLDLAGKGPALRAALAEEAASLLMEWPSDCPAEMKPVFENLLAKTAREVDADTRARLRVQLYADRALAARVLPRENTAASLIETARESGDVAPALSELLGLDAAHIRRILADDSGEALATAAKGGGITRAAYSTLALLTLPAGHDAALRLEAWEKISTLDAARRLREWRGAKMPVAAE